MTVWYVDFVNGNDANDGSTFALRCKTLANLTPNPGDAVQIMQSPSPQSLGVNCAWTNGSPNLTLASAVTKTITQTGTTNWTSAANVTCALSAVRRLGTNSQSTALGSSFTTGLASHFALESSTDFSAYTQITFWVQANGAVPANDLSIALCSDAAGAVIVNSIPVPIALVANLWYPITIETGAPLGSAIQSVALYVSTKPGNFTILLDNLEAVPSSSLPTSLSLNSLIGKNYGVPETWLAIRSIVGTAIVLDTYPQALATVQFPGYAGTSETVPAYKIETIPGSTTGSFQSTAYYGGAGSNITVSGGWDTVNMTTQPFETWIDGQLGRGTGFDLTSANYVSIDCLAATRYSTGFSISSANYVYGNIYGANNCALYGVNNSLSTSLLSNIYSATGNTSYGVIQGNSSIFNCTNLYANSNRAYGLYVSPTPTSAQRTYVTGIVNANNNVTGGIYFSSGGRLGNVTTNNNGNYGLVCANVSQLIVDSLTSTGNSNAGINFLGSAETRIANYTSSGNLVTSLGSTNTTTAFSAYINNANMSEPALVSSLAALLDQRVYLNNIGGTLNNNAVHSDGALVTVDTVTPYISGGLDYMIAIIGGQQDENYPFILKIPGLAFNGGSLVTFSCYASISSANIFANLVLLNGSIPGVVGDIIQPISGSGYNQYTMTFTPTIKGACDLCVFVWSGISTSDYVQISGPFSLSQA